VRNIAWATMSVILQTGREAMSSIGLIRL